MLPELRSTDTSFKPFQFLLASHHAYDRADLRRLAISRSLFPPTTLKRALQRMQFVQADPIRSPARAQDLILRHRVKAYRAGDLEGRYRHLGIEEDFFINYGFVTRELQSIMHPRSHGEVSSDICLPWSSAALRKKAQMILEFVRDQEVVHPKEVDKHFSHGKATNYWGGQSNATTHLLDGLHYRGMLRVARRESGIRLYAAHDHSPVTLDNVERQRRVDTLADVVIRIYAPMPARSLKFVLRRLRYAAPQWEGEIAAAIHRARTRLHCQVVEGVEWYWPDDWKLQADPEDTVRLLAPFDPVVWDRWRFEKLWGWTYRFEAYTPAEKRVRGYYAMPMLWKDKVIGWGNLSVKASKLQFEFGYVAKEPQDRKFKSGLEEELERMRAFLGVGDSIDGRQTPASPPKGAVRPQRSASTGH